jgi:histone acetyltransferase
MKKISSKDYEKLKSDYLLLKQEFENYKEKTIDKMKDLEFINILYDKTKKENEELKSKINKISNQNVSLQNKLDEFKNNKNIPIEPNIKRERSKIYSNGNLSRKNGYNNDFENVINNNININDNNIINNNNNNNLNEKNKKKILLKENFNFVLFGTNNNSKSINMIEINNYYFSKNKEMEFIKNIDEILLKIQQKKENLNKNNTINNKKKKSISNRYENNKN